MLVFKCRINFFNIIGGVKIIIVFFAKFFNVMPMVKEKRIIRALSVKVLNLKAKLIILNKFAIILQLN